MSKEAKDADVFYLKPLTQAPEDPLKPWFSRQPIGRNKLNQVMKTMSTQAGLSQVYTNHSFRTFGASRMFQHGVLEKLIQERTGHRSLEALRKYERVSEEQRETTSKVMNNTAQHQLVPYNPSVRTMQTRKEHPIPVFPTPQPTFSGCTFTGCSFTINVVQPPTNDDHLQGLDIKDIFADF